MRTSLDQMVNKYALDTISTNYALIGSRCGRHAMDHAANGDIISSLRSLAIAALLLKMSRCAGYWAGLLNKPLDNTRSS